MQFLQARYNALWSGLKLWSLYSALWSGLKLWSRYSALWSGLKLWSRYSALWSGLKLWSRYIDSIPPHESIHIFFLWRHSNTLNNCTCVPFELKIHFSNILSSIGSNILFYKIIQIYYCCYYYYETAVFCLTSTILPIIIISRVLLVKFCTFASTVAIVH